MEIERLNMNFVGLQEEYDSQEKAYQYHSYAAKPHPLSLRRHVPCRFEVGELTSQNKKMVLPADDGTLNK